MSFPIVCPGPTNTATSDPSRRNPSSGSHYAEFTRAGPRHPPPQVGRRHHHRDARPSLPPEVLAPATTRRTFVGRVRDQMSALGPGDRRPRRLSYRHPRRCSSATSRRLSLIASEATPVLSSSQRISPSASAGPSPSDWNQPASLCPLKPSRDIEATVVAFQQSQLSSMHRPGGGDA